MEVPTLRRSSFPEDGTGTNFSLFSESSEERKNVQSLRSIKHCYRFVSYQTFWV